MMYTYTKRFYEKDRLMVQIAQDNNWPCVAIKNEVARFVQQCHKNWCETNCQQWTYNQEYYFSNSTLAAGGKEQRIQHVDVFYFENEEDAVHFKMVWE